LKLPVKYYESNLVFNDNNDCYAIYRINGFDYAFHSEESQTQRLYRTARLLEGLGARTKILGKPYLSSIRDHHERLKKRFKGPLKEVAEAHTDGVADYLIRLRGDEGNEIKPFLMVNLTKMKRTFESFTKMLKGITREPIRMLDEILALDAYEIFEDELAFYKKAEESMYYNIMSRISAERASEMDQEWLVKQPFFRGLGEPPLRSNKDEPWRPGLDKVMKKGQVAISPRKRELLSLAAGEVEFTNDRHIRVVHADGRVSYQSFICLSYIPDLEFPGNEWLYQLNTLPFPVEYAIDIDFIENQKIREQARDKKKEVDDQIDHTSDSVEDIPIALIEARDQGLIIEDELKKTRSPHTLVTIDICVASNDLEELKERVKDVRKYFDDFGIQTEVPVSDQHLLFDGFFPGSMKAVTDYTHKLSPLTLAGCMFTATDIVGDDEGFFIGYTGRLKKPVFINPARAPQVDKTPSISNTGTLGGGKSFVADLIGYLNVLSGGRTLIFDPKNDRGKWPEHLKELEGHIEVVTLSGREEDCGKLDPFMIYDIKNKTGPEKEEAKREAYSLAVAIMAYIANVDTDSTKFLAITEACKYARDHMVPCMKKVLDFIDGEYMKNEKLSSMKDEFNQLSIQFNNIKDFANASLLFGDGENRSISVTKPLTILQIQNLSMPKKGKTRKNMMIEEMLSIALMYPIATFALKFSRTDRSVFKIVEMDESWALKSTAKGAELIDELVREGRAMNGGTILIGQNADDVDDDLKNNIGIKFAFRSSDTNQVIKTLEYFNMEVSDKNIETIKNIPKYHVLMQDLAGRVALVRIDAVYQHVMEAFNTRPKQESGEDGEKEKVS
jgi:hypothetical protein